MLEVFKLFGPLPLLVYFIISIKNKPSTPTIVTMLFFTSIAAFSQNFTFFYRELHQLLQVYITLLSVLYIYQNKQVSVTFVPLFVFFMFILFSLIDVSVDRDAKTQLFNFIVIFFVTLFLFSTVKKKEEFERLMFYIGGLGVVLAFIAIFEFLIRGVARAEATFANPNYLALYLGVSFSLVFHYHSKFKLFFLGVILLAIFLTGSRSAILIPLMVVCWSIWVDRFSYRKIFIIFIGLSVAISILTAENSRFNGQGLSASDAERIQFAKVALDMTTENPYTGVGWGRFISEFSNYSGGLKAISVSSGGEIDVSRQERRVSHNDLLRIAAELGVVALFSVLIFISISVYLLIIKRANGFDFIVPIWFGFLLFSLTHNNLNTAFSWFFFLIPFFIYKSNWRK